MRSLRLNRASSAATGSASTAVTRPPTPPARRGPRRTGRRRSTGRRRTPPPRAATRPGPPPTACRPRPGGPARSRTRTPARSAPSPSRARPAARGRAGSRPCRRPAGRRSGASSAGTSTAAARRSRGTTTTARSPVSPTAASTSTEVMPGQVRRSAPTSLTRSCAIRQRSTSSISCSRWRRRPVVPSCATAHCTRVRQPRPGGAAGRVGHRLDLDREVDPGQVPQVLPDHLRLQPELGRPGRVLPVTAAAAAGARVGAGWLDPVGRRRTEHLDRVGPQVAGPGLGDDRRDPFTGQGVPDEHRAAVVAGYADPAGADPLHVELDRGPDERVTLRVRRGRARAPRHAPTPSTSGSTSSSASKPRSRPRPMTASCWRARRSEEASW